jgi:rare lipoprotein A
VLVVATTVSACGARRGPAAEPVAPVRVTQAGVASWYGPGFHGKPTASGEIYDQSRLTAAHRTLPLGTRVRVTNTSNDRSVVVRINDRGPFVGDRILDLSQAAARELDMIGPGTARVTIEVLESPRPLAAVPRAVHFAVQVGSFGNREAAARLRDRAAELTAHEVTVVTARRDGTDYYRVLVGDFAERAEAEAERERLARANVSGILVER